MNFNSFSLSLLFLSSGVFAGSPPPNIPLNVTDSINTSGSYSISWGNVKEATYYKFYEKYNGSWSLLDGNVTRLSYSVSGRSSGRHAYVVYACNDYGCSSGLLTAAVTVNLNAKPPVVSSNWAKSPVDYNESATFSWSSSDEGYCELDGARVGTSGTRSYHLTSSTSKKVKCTNKWSKSAENISFIGVKPSTIPRNVRESISNTGKYTVTWGAASNVSYYKLFEKFNGGNWVQLDPERRIPSSQRTFEVVRNEEGRYNYVVHACNEHGCAGLLTENVVVSFLNTLSPTAKVSWDQNVAEYGTKALLSWESSNAKECTLDGAPVTTSGSQYFTITEWTNKVFSCTNYDAVNEKVKQSSAPISVTGRPDNSFPVYIGKKSKTGGGCNEVESFKSAGALTHVTDFIILPAGSTRCIPKYISYEKLQDESKTHEYFLEYISNALQKIVDANVDSKKVWISVPAKHGNTNFPSRGEMEGYLKALRAHVIAKFDEPFWNERVAGIYLYEESVNTDLINNEKINGKIDLSRANLGPGVNYIWDLRDAIDTVYNGIAEEALDNSAHTDWSDLTKAYHTNSYKGLRFAPYFKSRASAMAILKQVDQRPGIVFDKINIQSSAILTRQIKADLQITDDSTKRYYSPNNIDILKTFVDSQTMWFEGVDTYKPKKKYGKVTQIGIDMELDILFNSKILIENEGKKTAKQIEQELKAGNELKQEQRVRYTKLVNTYKHFVGNKTFLFFVESPRAYQCKNPALVSCVNNFYDVHFDHIDPNTDLVHCVKEIDIKYDADGCLEL